MSRNLGRKIHHIEQSNTHVKLMNEIADVKSLLGTSTQTTKELKTRLAEKKKDTGKSPRKIQAPSNRFDTPVPKIQGLLSATVTSTTTNDSVSASAVATGQPLDFDSDSEMQTEVNPWFEPEFPSFDFDLDLFNLSLEQEPIPEPTDAELAAHAFLRKVLGK